MQGSAACEVVSRFAGLAEPKNLVLGKIRYGIWHFHSLDLDASQNQRAGEQVVVCRTQDQVVEIHCHGGAAVCQAILQDLATAGCRIVTQTEWPSELLPLLQDCPLARAAEQELLKTTTDRAAAVLLDQMNGSLTRAIASVQRNLALRDLRSAETTLEELLEWADFGLHLARPWRVVLVGPPNVGKSSLMNALVGTHQAIVHSEPGTTRDWLESSGAIDGWPVVFTDTAGIRESVDPIEQAGVHSSLNCLRAAELAVLVVDASELERANWMQSSVYEELSQVAPLRRLECWNKVDLLSDATEVSRRARDSECILSSAVSKPGVGELLASISKLLVPRLPEVGQAVPFLPAQVASLTASLRAISSGQPILAEDLLSKLAGQG